MTTQEYWQVIRRTWKQELNINKFDEDLYLTSPQTLINDYDYCDWVFILDKDDEEYWDVDKYRRK